MVEFTYKAINSKGQLSHGQMHATNRKQAIHQLQQRGLKPVRIEAYHTLAPKNQSKGVLKWKRWLNQLSSNKRVRVKAATAQAFIQNLLQLHASGLPIADAVQLISNRVQNPSMRVLAAAMRNHLTSGRSLAEAMQQLPTVFDSNLVHLVEAGEATGNLVPILTNSLEHMDASRSVRNEIRTGLAYPFFICAMAIGIGMFTVTNLIPKLQALSEQMGGQPNALTQWMLKLADFSVLELPIITCLLLLAGVALWQWRSKSADGRLKCDGWLLHLPLAGPLVSDINLSKSFSALHLLLKNGISSIDAMRLSAYAIHNEVMRHRFLEARSSLQDGASFTQAFKKAQLLPITDLDLIGIGESTGSLLTTLDRLALSHRRELSKGFKRLTVIVSSCALGLAVSLVALLIFAIVISLQSVSESILTR